MASKRKPIPGYIRFPIAGLSGMGASMVVHPIDLVKVRMQLSGEGGAAKEHRHWFHAFKSVMKKEGITGLYAGLTATIYQQVLGTAIRMGTYQALVGELRKTGHDTVLTQILAAIFGGIVAAALGTPTQVALIRMTADGKLPPDEKRNYGNVFRALRRISKEEGNKGLFTGLKASLYHATVGNTAQLVSYFQTKEYLIHNGHMENNVKCHLVSSLVSGFVFAFATCPIDVLKTRIQFMKSKSPPMYSGVVDAMNKTVRKEGVTALWKGLSPLYFRFAPYTIVLMVFSEQLTYLYRKHFVTGPGSNY